MEGCESAYLARGFCNKHYKQWRITAGPDEVARRLPIEERFWAKVDRSQPFGCWPWLASKNPGDYGRFNVDHRSTVVAHRFAYEVTVGPIPEGLQLDHLCRNRCCVNPAHLEPVTAAVNKQRAVGERTHCPAGHELAGENVSIAIICRACRRKHTANSRRRAAEARVA